MIEGKVIEIVLEYNNLTACCVANTPDIEVFKSEFGYEIFSEKYGEIIFKNEKIKDKDNLLSADYHMFISVSDEKCCKKNFIEILHDIFYMLGINNRIFGILTYKIEERYSEVEGEYPHFQISVINQTSEQVVLFNYKNLMTIKEESSEYAKILE